MTSESSIPAERESWSSRTAFLLASVGAAVGFGNIWRFPALAYEYGGGAFFIPYTMALFLIGLPLLLLEISLGQHMQKGDIGVLGSINKRLQGVGLSAVLCGFIVTGYYVPLLSWVLRMFCESFGKMSDTWNEAVSGSDASQYFFDEIVGIYTLGDNLVPTRFVWTNYAYLIITWLCVGGCVAFGIKWTGRIAYVTMGLPILLLCIFFVRAVTLPGAGEGIYAYIGQWDASILVEKKDIWSTAVTQIFFSLGTTFGVMTAFGSHCPRNSPATENATVIAISNSLFSFVAGFAVFGSLGYLKNYENADHMDDVVTAGPSLMFGAYPAVLSTLPGGIHWIRILFINLFLLGIDSAFALTESVLTVVRESVVGKSFSEKIVLGVTVAIGCVMGILYSTDAGLYFLDTIDFYINFIMLLIGFCKAYSAGWMYELEDQKDKFGEDVVMGFTLTTFGSFFAASLCWFGIEGDTTLIGFITLFLLYGIGMYVVHRKLVQAKGSEDIKANMYDLYIGNVLKLKSDLEVSVGHIPDIWPYLLKHFIPQVLMILFFNLGFSKNEWGTEFANYGGYAAWPYQTIGMFVYFFIAIVLVTGIFYPNAYSILASDDDEKELSKTLSTEEKIVDDEEQLKTSYIEMHEES